MLSIKFNKIIINTLIVLIIFGLDRISKIYILSLAETNNLVDIYISPFLNLYLVWNKGIAFGLFSFDQKLIYNLITILIVFIIIIIFIMIIKSTHNRFFLLLILGGSLGNIFDRLYYCLIGFDYF